MKTLRLFSASWVIGLIAYVVSYALLNESAATVQPGALRGGGFFWRLLSTVSLSICTPNSAPSGVFRIAGGGVTSV